MNTPASIKSKQDLTTYQTAVGAADDYSAKKLNSAELLKDLSSAVSSIGGGDISKDKFNEALKVLDDVNAPLTTDTFEYSLKSKITETGSKDFATMFRAFKEIAGNDNISPFAKNPSSEVPAEVKEAHRDLATAKELEKHKIVKALDNREAELTQKIDKLQNTLEEQNNKAPSFFGKKAHEENKSAVVSELNKTLETSQKERRVRWDSDLDRQAQVAAVKANPEQASIVKNFNNKQLTAAAKENTTQSRAATNTAQKTPSRAR